VGSLVLAGPDLDAETGCGAVPAGLTRLLQEGALLLFGEMHGTREEPQAFGDAVCQAALAGREVLVGLELPLAEAGYLQQILAAPGEPAAAALLASMPFFTRDYQDGRSSQAMAELIFRLRRLQAAGLNVDLFPFDPAVAESRDRVMAGHIGAARVAHPEALILVLTGNLHARKSVGTPWDPGQALMGRHLLHAGHEPVSLRFSAAGGTAWYCTGSTTADCGERPVAGRPGGNAPSFRMEDKDMPEGYDGILAVGPVSASPPAATLGGRP
jgi:hypothetical protein